MKTPRLLVLAPLALAYALSPANAAGKVGAALSARAKAGDKGPVDVIVMLDRAAKDDDEATVRGLGGHMRGRFESLHGLSATLPAKAVAALADHADVRHVTYDADLALSFFDSSAFRTGDGAQATYVGAGLVQSMPEFTTISYDGYSPARVAVLDTGVRLHADLNANVVYRTSVIASDADDRHGHGTHIGG